MEGILLLRARGGLLAVPLSRPKTRSSSRHTNETRAHLWLAPHAKEGPVSLVAVRAAAADGGAESAAAGQGG